MKRIFISLSLLLMYAAAAMAGTPKYVFFFIGDGMGMNQVNGTETYLAAQQGRIGIVPLLFADFPYTAFATTHSASHGITDSAAGGTALATGRKTFNNALGIAADSVTKISSIAAWAKASGKAVGVATSVSVDHATPAAFYAHQTHRSKYYEIGLDLIQSGFDFFGGSDFLKPENPKGGENLYEQCRKAGYTIARGMEQYARLAPQANRMILLQSEAASTTDRASLPYAIDRKPGDITLTDITRAAIDFLYKKSPEEGFFCMIEGGKIDWACHSNDAATVFEEVIDLDKAIRVAYDFLQQHPDETLIVVTADHETGGLGLGNSNYTLQTQLLKNQAHSSNAYSEHLAQLRKEMGDKLTWERIRQDLENHFGFWTKVPISEEQEDMLEDAFEKMVEHKDKDAKSLYSSELALADLAKRILNQNAKLGWTSGAHTNGYVPVFAVGAKAETFHGRIDNTHIPQIMGMLAGYTMPQFSTDSTKGNPGAKK